MNKPDCQILDDIQAISNTSDLRAWIRAKVQSSESSLKYLLVHAEDGVIWGYFDLEGNLITATEPEELFSQYKFPFFRYETLQQGRIFGDSQEIMFWRTEDGLRAINIKDDQDTEFITEKQILWGTQAEEVKDKFTLVSDGSQGLRHAVPLLNIEFDRTKELYRPLYLVVRNYIDDDEKTGLARISLSRLVSLKSRKVIDEKAHS
ncbi:TIGR03984 family CRISPR-associated protein [Nostoc sp. FACHB-87]|uniref:type III-D CRISPR-associated protein Csx19 n=1 Tax=Nostocaceae TaxID=1162 RepID=UPI0016891AC4|nr:MULTISPECIES: CRISPR-associated protein Csx19 [Nostocaceae]MBD2454063.1 TIGR03984 family CRISPR-associated protein [Nostoc sp. FACHB-87]MBD2476242.1 TIGR03984 family CRISPR-associated protein [Anabaena sp. FACHB-83]